MAFWLFFCFNIIANSIYCPMFLGIHKCKYIANVADGQILFQI